MCSERCRNSIARRCRCSCGGTNHGKNRFNRIERSRILLRRYPPCTPIRVKCPTTENFIYGKIGTICVMEEIRVFVLPFRCVFLFDEIEIYDKTKDRFRKCIIGAENPD